MTESNIDYASVTVDQLDLAREPRKSKFALVHKPSGTRAEDPVVPGTLTEARFRRHTNLPKENRVPDMIGYIEGHGDDPRLFIIVGGENPRNEYLDALVSDKAALKACFEGPPATTEPSPGEQPAPAEPPPSQTDPQPAQEQPASPPEQPEAAQVAVQEADASPPEDESQLQAEAPQGGEPVEPTEMQQLDDLLAGLN